MTPLITSFKQTLYCSFRMATPPSRQLDLVYSDEYSPVYAHIDRSWKEYSNFPVIDSTNCIEGIILGYFNMDEKEINDYSKKLLNDGTLINLLYDYNKKEHGFFVRFLNESINLTENR